MKSQHISPKLASILIRLYPRPWRTRFAAEFEQLLLDSPASPSTLVNVLTAALHEHLITTQRSLMTQPTRTFSTLLRYPSAFLPLALSILALGVLLSALGYDFIHSGGIVHGGDEGAAAHLWQLMIGGQLPIIAFFAIKWLPRAPRQSLPVLAIQAAAVLTSMAPVYFLGL